MKKIILVFACVTALCSVKAQQGTTQIGIAAEIGIPTGDFGDFFKTGFGGSVKGLFGIGTAGQITFTTGYTKFKGKETDLIGDYSASIIPLLAGYRHNFSGFYVEPQVGYGIYGGESDGENSSDGAFTYAIGLGIAKSGFDGGVRYQAASKDGSTTSLIGIHIGYNFTLGGGTAKK